MAETYSRDVRGQLSHQNISYRLMEILSQCDAPRNCQLGKICQAREGRGGEGDLMRTDGRSR